MTAPRLTLETAEQRVMEFIREDYESLGRLGPDEPTARAVDFAEALGGLAQAAAADAVRAYRERCAIVEPDSVGVWLARDPTGTDRDLWPMTIVAVDGGELRVDLGGGAEEVVTNYAWVGKMGERCAPAESGAVDWHATALHAMARSNEHSRRLSEVRDALSSIPGNSVTEDDRTLAEAIDALCERLTEPTPSSEPRVDVEALRALLADMEGPDILTHSQACEVLSEGIGDTPRVTAAIDQSKPPRRNYSKELREIQAELSEAKAVWRGAERSAAKSHQDAVFWKRSQFDTQDLVRGLQARIDTLREGFGAAVARATSATYRLGALTVAVEGVLSDITEESKTAHAKANGRYYIEALGLAHKWIAQALTAGKGDACDGNHAQGQCPAATCIRRDTTIAPPTTDDTPDA